MSRSFGVLGVGNFGGGDEEEGFDWFLMLLKPLDPKSSTCRMTNQDGVGGDGEFVDFCFPVCEAFFPLIWDEGIVDFEVVFFKLSFEPEKPMVFILRGFSIWFFF